MTKLLILRGVSGSGKSTWAKHQHGYTVISRDALRVMLFGTDGREYYDRPSEQIHADEDQVSVLQDSMIAGLLKSGRNVIVDNTNIQWKFVKALAKIGYRYGAEVEVKVFDVSLNEAIARDIRRGTTGGRFVGDAVITRQYKSFKANKSKQLDPVQPLRPYNGTPGKPQAFLVDIDGTLAHMNNKRGPFEWAKVGVDDADEVISSIVDDLGTNREVIVMSGRDESCRAQTEEWLVDKANIWWDKLFMRPANDMRPDNIIKAELFDTYVRDNYDVKFVLDDRQQVVDMWRRMGLTCLQVAEGDF